jgi:hypothetical protein
VLSVPWWLSHHAGPIQARPYLASAALYVIALTPYAAAYVLLVGPNSLLGFVQSLFEGTVAGVLALLAPGGLGVRESWVAISQVEDGGKEMLGTLILARVLIIASEIAISFTAMAWPGWTARRASSGR